MTPEARELEAATWDVAMVDAEVKLYLLALIRTSGDHETAQRLSGLDEHAARSARGWLMQVGVLHPDGTLDEKQLRGARHARLSVVAA
jgi:hypothetical protein